MKNLLILPLDVSSLAILVNAFDYFDFMIDDDAWWPFV